MKELNKVQNALFMAGGVMLLLGAAAFLFVGMWAAVVYIIGALLFASMQMLTRYEGTSVVIKRLRRQQIMGAFCLLVAGGLMALNMHFVFGVYLRNEWVVALVIGAVLELYTSFRIPSELDKEK